MYISINIFDYQEKIAKCNAELARLRWFRALVEDHAKNNAREGEK